jgi:hypothetical protein
MACAALTAPMPYRLTRPEAMSSTMASSWAWLSLSWRRAWPSADARRAISACRTECSRRARAGSSRPARVASALWVRALRAARRSVSFPGQQQAAQPAGLSGAGRPDLLPGDQQDAQRLPVAVGTRHRKPARVQAQRGQHRQVRIDRVGLTPAAAPLAAGPLALDHHQPGGGQRPRQPDPVTAGALNTDRHPRPGRRLRDRGQQPREPRAVVTNPHRRDRPARRIGDHCLMSVAVGVDPDDGIYRLCQHGHTASCLLPGPGADVGTGLGGVTGWHICDGSRQLADRLLIRSTRWARPGPAIWGQVSSKARNSGRIRSESPRIADPDPGGSPPRTAGNDTHRSVVTCIAFSPVRIGSRPGMFAGRLSVLVRLIREVVRPGGSQVGSRRRRPGREEIYV